MNLTCIIVDDEPNAVSLLQVLIAQVTSWKVVAISYDGVDALNAIKLQKPDLIFLDINMPLLNGMELAGLIAKEIKLVFTTAYSEFAAESYNFQTIDYLLKPITLKRFLTTTEKIEKHFQSGSKIYEDGNPQYYFIKCGKVLRKVVTLDIFYFEGDKEYVRLVTHKEQFLVYKRIKEIEDQLRYPFIRVHNSYIINVLHIEKLQDNHIFIANKQIPISEKFKKDFQTLININLF